MYYVTETVLQRHKRIVGGEDADVSELPYLVQLHVFKQDLGEYIFKCSGTLIVARWILTAAQCLKTDQVGYSVLFGHLKVVYNSELQQLSRGNTRHTLEAYFIHDDYNPDGNYKNDVALLKV